MSMERTNDIEEIASEWLIRRDSDRWQQSDQVRLQRWLDESTENRVVFLRLELAWEESARLKALGAGVPGDLPPPPGRLSSGTLFFSRRSNDAPGARGGAPVRRRVRLAAVAGVVLAATASLGVYLSGQLGGERYATPVGGLAKVPIVDGSKITLNTDSQVRVALSRAERHIDLKQGEAFFEVASDPSRPFVVEAGGNRVIAVGTKFSVRNDGNSVEVVVTEGKVRIEDSGSAARLLTPGAVAVASDVGVSVRHLSVEDAETRLSWREGVLTFRDADLAAAVAEFNRYNLQKIVIADPAVASLKVEGNFRPTNAEAFIRLLELGFPVRASREGDRIILVSR